MLGCVSKNTHADAVRDSTSLQQRQWRSILVVLQCLGGGRWHAEEAWAWTNSLVTNKNKYVDALFCGLGAIGDGY